MTNALRIADLLDMKYLILAIFGWLKERYNLDTARMCITNAKKRRLKVSEHLFIGYRQ
jgi:hypothetical protein